MEDFEKWWAEYTANSSADANFLSLVKGWAESAWKAATLRSVESRINITHIKTVGTQAYPLGQWEEL